LIQYPRQCGFISKSNAKNKTKEKRHLPLTGRNGKESEECSSNQRKIRRNHARASIPRLNQFLRHAAEWDAWLEEPMWQQRFYAQPKNQPHEVPAQASQFARLKLQPAVMNVTSNWASRSPL
jgi:hypothetical protein